MTTQEFTGHVSAMRADSEFLGAEDLAGRGDVPIRIVKCNRCLNRKACGRTEKEMFTLSFEMDGVASKKELWLKPTNRKRILSMYGANVGEWKGKWLWLYIDEVKSPQGGMTLGIRIRDKRDAPQQTASESPGRTAPQNGELVMLHTNMKSKWKGRREERGLSVDADQFRIFVEQATGGLVPAMNALNVPSFSAELIEKCVEHIRSTMPEPV